MNPPFSQARWVWTADLGHPHYAVRRFRAGFQTAEAQTLRLHVSADSRFLLFWDGQRLGRGPARSDLRHSVYETYTVSAAPGAHTLAALVLAYGGPHCPIAEMHERGAFVLEAQTETGEVVCATGDASWRVQADTAYQPVPIIRYDGYYAIGSGERVDGARLPRGWEQPGYDDSDWEMPVAVVDAYLWERPGDMADPGGRWRLIPRDIPPLREEARRFAGWDGPPDPQCWG